VARTWIKKIKKIIHRQQKANAERHGRYNLAFLFPSIGVWAFGQKVVFLHILLASLKAQKTAIYKPFMEKIVGI
jgi:hypothetical protein